MKILKFLSAVATIISFLFLFSVSVSAQNVSANLPFTLPSLPYVIGFVIRLFFIIAGVIALVYLLLGAFAWVTSGGNKENVEKAREKIQAAIIGLILIVIVIVVLAAVEQFVFNKKVCFGLTCDLTLPALLNPEAPQPTSR